MPSPGVATSVSHGCETVAVAACCSAMLICLRMNFRSPVVTVKPWPVGGVAALARLGRTDETATTATSAMRNSIAETATVR